MFVQINESKAKIMTEIDDPLACPFQIISEKGLLFIRNEAAKVLGVKSSDLSESQVWGYSEVAEFELNEGQLPVFEVVDGKGDIVSIQVPSSLYFWVVDKEALLRFEAGIGHE